MDPGTKAGWDERGSPSSEDSEKGAENGGGRESQAAWWRTADGKLEPPLTPTSPRQVSANGNVLRSEIVGSIKMRVFLSGMPELRLGLNDKVLFDNTGRE